MIPLTMAEQGETKQIKRIGGKDEVKRFLGSLGFAEGASVTVVSQNGGNVIVNMKESRIAISREMALKIMI